LDNKDGKLLGECSIDLAAQRRGNSIKEKLKLEKCETETPSYLEI
jgi:hypothetical protein